MSLTARQGPAGIWIELTSKCPLRCVFCSRENLRGEGEHMDISMLDTIVGSLDRPETIRLNYSGESANYPWLIEAIEKTKAATHAHVEIVTSLVTLPMEMVGRLARSGIDRISISLHTLDGEKFRAVYGGGSLDAFERRLERLVDTARARSHPPAIDFAAVAMQSNVNELPAIAAMAAGIGAASLSIHPVIRRSGVPSLFQIEAQPSGQMTEAFQRELNSRIAEARNGNSGVRVSVARPPADCHPGPFTCEQNPFETTHILSNGDVVACEVMDRKALGNLHDSNLRDIWRGQAYQNLRDRYEADDIPECAGCIFRTAAAEMGAVRTSWGWYDRDEAGALWSRTTSSFECAPDASRSLVLTGLLPPGGSAPNRIEFSRGGKPVGWVRNESSECLQFRVELGLDHTFEFNRFVAHTEQGFSPWRRGFSNDARELGFALFSAEVSGAEPGLPAVFAVIPAKPILKEKAADLLLHSLGRLERIASRSERAETRPGPPDDSIGVIIPERGNAAMLASCLAALEVATARTAQRIEVVIVVNGSSRADYGGLMRAHRNMQFVFVSRPLGFTAAIRRGLRHVRAGWTYLLNNDMSLDPDALISMLPHRTVEVFSLASRIVMREETSERETNRTGIEFVDGLANLVELDGTTDGPVEHYYSGGGSSLFQTDWLRHFIGRTICYDPFYWEDAEWGVRARSAGLRNVFVPESFVQHEGKATVGRFYEPSEVSRIFERNRIQFQLRCVRDSNIARIRERLANAPWQTLRELWQPFRMASMARTRAALAKSALIVI